MRTPLCVLLMSLLLASCGKGIPQPFMPDDTDNELLILPDRGGIVVEPVAGVAQPLAGKLAEAMAAALTRQEIIATTNSGNAESLHLRAQAEDRAAPDAPVTELALAWTLTRADGSPAGAIAQTESLPRAALDRLDAGMLKLVADKGAMRLAELLRHDKPVTTETAATKPPLRFALAAIDNAPGDGATALTDAMRRVLRRLALLAPPDDADALVLTGKVLVAPSAPGRETATITWIAADAKGAELGRISQSNMIPAGALAGAWGEAADAVAQGAAIGLQDMLRRLKQ